MGQRGPNQVADVASWKYGAAGDVGRHAGVDAAEDLHATCDMGLPPARLPASRGYKFGACPGLLLRSKPCPLPQPGHAHTRILSLAGLVAGG